MKVLLFVIVALVILAWVSRVKQVDRGSATRHSKDGREGEPMVRCIHCGVHLPVSESVTATSGAVFCSDEHRLRHGA